MLVTKEITLEIKSSLLLASWFPTSLSLKVTTTQVISSGRPGTDFEWVVSLCVKMSSGASLLSVINQVSDVIKYF